MLRKRNAGAALALLLATGAVSSADNVTPATARSIAMNSTSQDFLQSGSRASVWYKVQMFAGRSYQLSVWTSREDGVFVNIDPVELYSDPAGAVLVSAGVTTTDGALEGSPNDAGAGPRTTVFQPTATGLYLIHAGTDTAALPSMKVNIRVRETTMFSPWLSKAAGFEGFIELHNNTSAAVSVTLKAYDNTGTLQGAGLTFPVPANATVFQTGGGIGVPVGVAAGVVLTHNGAFGAISGNITTLNGANGLSFDSPFTVRDPGGAGGGDSSATSGVNSDITSLTALTTIMKGGNPFLHSSGTRNTFVGENAGNFTMSGLYNTAAGSWALQANSTGDNNTANGVGALQSNTTGFQNTAVGVSALRNNISGQNNTATGMLALLGNTTGNSNTATGSGALQNNNGFYNTAVGQSALGSNTNGAQNAALGLGALMFNTTGYTNTATGTMALLNNTTGIANIAIGFNAGSNLTTGNNNIDIGNLGVEGESNTIRIGTPGTHTATYVAGNTSVSGTLSWTGTAAGDISGSAASATTVAGLVCADGQVAKWSGSAWTCGADTNSLVYDAGSGALLAGARTVIGQGTTGATGIVAVNLTPPAAFSTSSYVCAVTPEGPPVSPAPAITYTSGTQFSVEISANKPFRFICIGL